MNTLFVTGTDTGVGKTWVSRLLLSAARRRGIRACGFKPVASGCQWDDSGQLVNDDALALQSAAGTDEPYAAINPYAFIPPIAPHIAAHRAGVDIDRSVLDRAAHALEQRYDWLLVEGAGGWQVPLDARIGFADWVAERRWPVLMVVGIRLGCINHALLTAESIRNRGLVLAGWVANQVTPQPEVADDSIEFLGHKLGQKAAAHLRTGDGAADHGDRLLHALFGV